jgi:DNA-binding NarL/FixJ family response regulator
MRSPIIPESVTFTPMKVRVAIVEDRRSIRESLSMLIDGSPGLELVGAYPDCNHLIAHLKVSLPDIVLMDIELPGMNGIEAVGLLKQEFPNITVIMQTVFDDDDKVFNAICAGASGYLLKDTAPARLIESIIEAANGGAPMSPSIAKKALALFQKYLSPAHAVETTETLTQREKEVLQWLVKGYSYKMIAEACQISFDTVRTHIRNIYEKLHVASSTQAVARAIKERLV